MTRMFVSLVVMGLLFCPAMPVHAGEFNSTLNIGDKAPAWKDLPGVDGKKHSFEEWKDKDWLVVFFTCNSCPTATDYEERVIAFTKKYATTESKVGVVALNVNTIAEDNLEAMTARAREKEFPFPYLFDESQQIGKAYGAVFTPEFFLLNRTRQVIYMGGFDDHSDPQLAKTQHLEEALKAAMAGQKPKVAETVAIGCRVRYVSERRKKK